MDLLTTTRMLVAEYRLAGHEYLNKLEKKSTQSSTSNGSSAAIPSKMAEKKKSWLGLARKKPVKSSESSEKEIPSQESGEGQHVGDRTNIGDDDGSSQAVRGMRKWLVALCSQNESQSDYALQVTTTCRLLLDAAREQFECFVESNKGDAGDDAKHAKKSNTGLLKMLAMKSTGGAANPSGEFEDEEDLDLVGVESDDASLALNSLSDILSVASAINTLPGAFIESIISLCFEELNTACTFESRPRRNAAYHCMSVISANAEAFTYLCNSVISKSLQSAKGPSLPKHCHKLRFGFGTPHRATLTLKLLSQLTSCLSKLENDRLEACLLGSAILQGANEYGGNAFRELLDKKQQDQFMTDLKLYCETMMKWSKKRIEPVRAITQSLAIALCIWAALCKNEKELAEVLEMRKYLVVDRIVSGLRSGDDVQATFKLASSLLALEAKMELYKHNEAWRAQTLQKLMPAVLKQVGHFDVLPLLISCVQIQPDEVVDDWIFSSTAGVAGEARALIAMRAVSLAICKGGFQLAPATLKSLMGKHIEPVIMAEDLTRIVVTTGHAQDEPEDEAKGGNDGGTPSVEEELGIALIEPAQSITWLEKDCAVGTGHIVATNSANSIARHGSSMSTNMSVAEQLAIHALKTIPHLFNSPYPEKILHRIAYLAVTHSSRPLASQATETLRTLGSRDEAVKAVVDMLSTAEVDSPRTIEGLEVLRDLSGLAASQPAVSTAIRVQVEGVLTFHRLASLRQFVGEGKVSLKGEFESNSARDQARTLARARLRPLLRGIAKLRASKHSKELTGALVALMATSGSGAGEKAELDAVMTSLLGDLSALPIWLVNRILFALKVALPSDCEVAVCETIKTKLGVFDDSQSSAFSTLQQKYIHLVACTLKGMQRTVSESDAAFRIVQGVANRLFQMPNPFVSQPDSFVSASLKVLCSFVDSTAIDEEAVSKCIKLLLGCGRFSNAGLERLRMDLMGALSHSDKLVLADKVRLTFADQIAQWWLQVAQSDESGDFERARRVLVGILRNPGEKNQQADPPMLVTFVERALKETGPVGMLHFAALLTWLDCLDEPPSSPTVIPLVLLATLSYRKAPPNDSLVRVLDRLAAWRPEMDRSKRMLLAMLAAEDLRDFGDSGVALMASKACAKIGAALGVEPALFVQEAELVAARLTSENAIRVLLIVLEPWILATESKSDAFFTALYKISESALTINKNLRYVVLDLWRACGKSCAVQGKLLDFCWSTASPLALQVWRAAVESADVDLVLDACLEKARQLPHGTKGERPDTFYVDIILTALRYANEVNPPDAARLGAVLGKLAHLTCVSESVHGMRLLLRFARETTTADAGEDLRSMRQRVLKAVAADEPVMRAACATALEWVELSHENMDLAAASAVFIMELHHSLPANQRQCHLPHGGVSALMKCALRYLKRELSALGGSDSNVEKVRACGSLIRSVLRFASIIDLENNSTEAEAATLLAGLAGMCLHSTTVDTQLEASLVLRKLSRSEQRQSAYQWFTEASRFAGADDGEDALVQFLANADKHFSLVDVQRILDGLLDDANGVKRATKMLVDLTSEDSAIESSKSDGGDQNGALWNVETDGDAFVDSLSAVMYWENANVREASLRVLALHVGLLKKVSVPVACRALRSAMNEFVHPTIPPAANGNSSIAMIASEKILLGGAGLDDGISAPPVSLQQLFVVTPPILIICLEKLLGLAHDVSPPLSASQVNIVAPPIPPSRGSTRSNEEEKSAGGGSGPIVTTTMIEKEMAAVIAPDELEEMQILEDELVVIDTEKSLDDSFGESADKVNSLDDIKPIATAVPAQQRRKVSEDFSGVSRTDEEFDRRRKVAQLPIAVDKSMRNFPSNDLHEEQQPKPAPSPAVVGGAIALAGITRRASQEKLSEAIGLPRRASQEKLAQVATTTEEAVAPVPVVEKNKKPAGASTLNLKIDTTRATVVRSSSQEKLKLDLPLSPTNSNKPKEGGPSPSHGGATVKKSSQEKITPLSPTGFAQFTKRATTTHINTAGLEGPLSPTGGKSATSKFRERPTSPIGRPASPTGFEVRASSRRPSLETFVPVLTSASLGAQPPTKDNRRSPVDPSGSSSGPPSRPLSPASGSLPRNSSFERFTFAEVSKETPRNSSLENVSKAAAIGTNQTVVVEETTSNQKAGGKKSVTVKVDVPDAQNQARRLLPGLTDSEGFRKRQSAVDPSEVENAHDETGKSLEHHSLSRPLIPSGRRRRPTVNTRIDGEELL